MRLLFVNHVHPDSNLVGAVRLQRFAEELAERGHQVLLLCATQGQADTPATFGQRISAHDWSTPLVLSIPDDTANARRRAASPVRRPLQRARTAFDLIVHGGPFWRWQHAARAFREPIRQLFAPELAYATFGNLDALAIARDYARESAIPWVLDIKDPATNFIPRPFRGWLMRRYRDASATTLNAEFQRQHSGCWANPDATVLYSGVEASTPQTSDYDPLQVAMVGSIYSDEAATILLRGFAAWRQTAAPGATLHYFGMDTAQFKASAVHAGITGAVVAEGQVSRAHLLARCARMTALVYTVHPQHAFHHKLLELGALGRPIITSPGESPEADELCKRYGIIHSGAITADVVEAALTQATTTPTATMQALRAEMSWAAAATRLEQIFRTILDEHPAEQAP